ncbi:MAG: hypothetical protein HOB69_11135, partial [Flavobacterium sp.]|nr:hypothetical protein [Flavobacterium sp.]
MEKLLSKIQSKSCIIEIFGLGYVGFPLAVKLSSVGFNVIGVDVNKKRISRLKRNELQDSEGLGEAVQFSECNINLF